MGKGLLAKNLLVFLGLAGIILVGAWFLTGALGFCFPDMGKDKVVVIVAKGGIYDTEDVAARVSEYYASVKKDLYIDNTGLKKFDGKTTGELDSFIDGLYVNDGVGYVILLGDDLPIIKEYTVKVISVNTTIGPPGGMATCLSNDSVDGVVVVEVSADVCSPGKFASLTNGVEENFSCIGGSCRVVTKSCESEPCPIGGGSGGYYRCRDVAISYIIPPLLYSGSEKVDFVLKVLSTYTGYHNNFADYASKYQKSILHISLAETKPVDGGGGPLDPGKVMLGYDLPVVTLLHTEGDKISNELKDKHILLFLGVHGAPESLLFGIGIPNQGSISSDEYSSFAKENGLPALFVHAGSCNSLVLGKDDLRHCCWPQVFMESGVWAYYSFGYGQGMATKFMHEKTIGLAVRKSAPTQVFIFGDILAHMG